MLKLHRVDSGYGAAQVLHGVSLEVGQGEVVCLLGSNGAGKSTTLMTILGLLRPTRGEIGFCGRSLQGMSTSDIVKTGLAIVPEGRRVFGPLTVFENLQVAAAACGVDGDDASVLEPVLELFPDLRGRMEQAAGTLSGGQQQMLAIARALVTMPKMILMDEPSMGLSPVMAERVFEIIGEIRDQGVAVLLVEQNAHATLSVASRGYVLQSGEVVMAADADELRESALVREAYL